MAVAHQAPLSMAFSRQECWSGLSGSLPDPETEPMSSALADMFFTTEPPGKPTLATCSFKKPISGLLTFAVWIQLFFQNKLLSLLNSSSQYLLVDYTIPALKPSLEVLSVISPLTFLKNLRYDWHIILVSAMNIMVLIFVYIMNDHHNKSS